MWLATMRPENAASRGDKSARGLRGMITANAGLRVAFELIERYADAFPVGFADTLIAADQRGEGDRLGRGKSRIPPGPVLLRQKLQDLHEAGILTDEEFEAKKALLQGR